MNYDSNNDNIAPTIANVKLSINGLVNLFEAIKPIFFKLLRFVSCFGN